MKRTGFTLIELLVVIAVIAMLIGILIPVLRTARRQARTVTCGSNIKQLALGLTIYDQENGTFPHGFNDNLPLIMTKPPGGYPGTHMRDMRGWWWFHFLADIQGEGFSKGTILWCPSRNIRDPFPKANVLCGNYGVNQAICKNARRIMDCEFFGTPSGLNGIRRAAETLLIADSGYSLISWRAAANAPGQLFENTKREGNFYVPGLWINKERILLSGCERDAVNGRHPSKSVNVGFVDGHISRVKADDLFVEETGSKYKNRSPLWLPK